MFEQRSTASEIMDSSTMFGTAEAEASFRFIRRINRYFGGAAVVRQFIGRQLQARSSQAPPLHVLDVGCGCADIAVLVCQWFRRHGHNNIRFTCLESDPQALSLAAAAINASGLDCIDLVHADIFCHQPAAPYDCAVASMLLHHFDSSAAARLLSHLLRIVRGGILINDLQRCLPAWLGAGLLSCMQPWPVRHDAQLSVCRGFRRQELQCWLQQWFSNTESRVDTAWAYRIYAELGTSSRRSDK